MTTQTHITAAELDAQLTQHNAAPTPEAKALSTALADLRASSLAVADFRLLAPRPSAEPSRSPRLPRWALATATAAMAVALAIPAALRTHQQKPVANVPAAPQTIADSTLQDDALLAAIQTDLSASVPASLEPLATTSTTSTK